jgi:DnaJ family protein C protein 7
VNSIKCPPQDLPYPFVTGDLENAMKHLQQAVRSDPDNTTVRTYYRKIKEIDERKTAGDEAFKSGDHNAAVEAYAQCITLTKGNRPFSAKLHLNRATAYLRLKNYDNAVKDCSNAIYYNDKYVKAYLRRAESYVASNTPENIEKGIR